MSISLIKRLAVIAVSAHIGLQSALAQVQPAASPASDLPLFVVEITVGPKWDPNKPPQEQQFFREHSLNLKRLRDSGALIMGARYSDKGLVVLAAQDETHARSLMDEDPSIKADVFKVQVHSFNVFYGGTINARVRRSAQ